MKYVLIGTNSNFGNMFSMAGASLLVPFLPMLPTQILLNNFLYDFSQIAIPGDRVAFLLYVGVTTVIYLAAVELVKRRLVPRMLA